MHFGQCALYTRAGAREGRPCWVSTRNALQSTHGHVPALTGVCYSGQADRECNPTDVATSYSWREGSLLRGASPVP